MGREAAVTPEQVHDAADAIKAEGGKPTLRSVRERLGTGSMGTINKYLQGWKAGQERQQAAEPAIPLLCSALCWTSWRPSWPQRVRRSKPS